MTKRKIIRKSNRPFTYNPHYYAWGGDFKTAMGGIKPFDLKGTFSGGNVAGMLKGGLASGLGSAVGNVANKAISGGLESGAGKAISNIGGTIGGAVGMVNPVLGGAISAASGIIGGLTNRAFGSKLNQEKIANVESSNQAVNTVMVDSSSADSIENQWANQDFGADFSKSDIGKDGWFSSKAKKKYRALEKQQDIARNRALTSYENAANAADTQSDLNAMANFSAYGGPLSIFEGYGSGAIGYELAKENLDIKALNATNKSRLTSLPNSFESTAMNTFATGGKIHINPENKGKFTESANRADMGVQEFASHVLANKEDYSPTQVKRANFARNAKKFKHAFGGDLLTHGADFNNGLTVIDNGGTHEENPMEGVPMGKDQNGTPNLVEQGEVIFNDYVFSNRIFADGGLLESFNLPKSYDGYSFAAIAERLGEESKERPNDPISKRGLMSSMSKLQQAQETMRQNKQVGQEGVQHAYGGKLGNLYAGPGGMPQFLNNAEEEEVIPIGYTKRGVLMDNAEIVPYNDPVTQAQDSAGVIPTNNQKKEDKTKNDRQSSRGLTWLRYAPAAGSLIGIGQNLFSSPDYSSANAILEAANQAGNYIPVDYNPIGNYLQYNPFDRNFYINKLNAQAGATRRAIMNNISPSRNATLLAADYNAQGRLGDLARQAEEYNLAQRQQVEQFNRGTNQANAEMGLKAAMANQEATLKARSSKLSGIAQAMAVRDAVDARRGASMSANLTNLFDSLGNIGIDAYNRKDRDKLIRAGLFGTLSEKPQEWSDKRWEDYRKAVSGEGYKKSYGGKLKKKRGGFTY